MQNILGEKKGRAKKLRVEKDCALKLREGIYNQHTCVCVRVFQHIVQPT